jgi:hypothetical protein
LGLSRWLKNQWDRAAALAAAAIGLIAIILGWFGMSRVTFPGQQLPYLISGGVFGLFALGMGATLWLSADLRDQWRKLDALRQPALNGSVAAQETDLEGFRDAERSVPVSAPAAARAGEPG